MRALRLLRPAPSRHKRPEAPSPEIVARIAWLESLVGKRNPHARCDLHEGVYLEATRDVPEPALEGEEEAAKTPTVTLTVRKKEKTCRRGFERCCSVCGSVFAGRADAKTCRGRCRTAAWRTRNGMSA